MSALTVAEVAALFDVSRPTVERWLSTDALPHAAILPWAFKRLLKAALQPTPEGETPPNSRSTNQGAPDGVDRAPSAAPLQRLQQSGAEPVEDVRREGRADVGATQRPSPGEVDSSGARVVEVTAAENAEAIEWARKGGFCGDRPGGGRMCTRMPGHSGDHVGASIDPDEAVFRWAQAAAEPKGREAHWPLWFVWTEDYPDEGSEVVDARSADEAKRRSGLADGNDVSALDCSPVTPDDVDKLRDRIEELERAAKSAKAEPQAPEPANIFRKSFQPGTEGDAMDRISGPILERIAERGITTVEELVADPVFRGAITELLLGAEPEKGGG